MSADMLAVGEVFHEKYKVLRELAKGGMGAVYEVLHTETERRAALKVMLPSVLGSQDLRNRFRAEARVASGIESEHIVEILDAGVDKATGNPFLVMELLRGQDLLGAIETEGTFDHARALTILGQLSRTLDKTHAAKVVHRDLKPDNVFLTTREDGTIRVKILDFGIAKIIAEGNQATRKLGTPLYAAPEQFNASSPISPQTDLYALAHIVFTMLVGTPYWMEEMNSTDSVHAFLASLQLDRTEAATSRAKHYGRKLPARFDAWFKRATSLRAADRFPSAGEQHAALVEVLGAAEDAAPASGKAELGTMAFLAAQDGGAAASTAAPSNAAPSSVAAAVSAPSASVTPAVPAPSVARAASLVDPVAETSASPSRAHGEGAAAVAPIVIPVEKVSSPSAKGGSAAIGTLHSSGSSAPDVARSASVEAKKGPPIGLIAVGGAALVGLVVGGIVLFGGKTNPTTASADPSGSVAAPTTPAPSGSTSVAVRPRSSASASTSSKPPSAELDEITFKKTDPRVGDVVKSHTTAKRTIELTRPIKSTQTNADAGTQTETILAADGKTILKLKITYGAMTSESTEGGKTTTTKSPVSDKTYVVEYKSGALVVTDENYKPVPAAEAALVKADQEKTVGKPLIQLTSLPDGPVKKGSNVDTVAEIIRAETVDAQTDVGDLVVSLKSIEKSKDGHHVAVFAVSLKVIVKDPQFTTTATLSGTLSIRDDSKPVSYALEGPIALKGAQVEGSGSWSMETRSD